MKAGGAERGTVGSFSKPPVDWVRWGREYAFYKSISYPMSRPDTEPFDLEDALHLPVEQRVFYHGTSKRNARHIVAHGLRDWSWIDTTPKLRYLSERGGVQRYLHDGNLGRGTYLTCNWRIALFYGSVLFRVSLRPGTRLLRMDLPPDHRVLDSLKREFGREILKKSPLKVMPRNKRLTLNEAIQLARHHYFNYTHIPWPKYMKEQKRVKELRSILVRYGFHGWGEANHMNGTVIFATDRIRLHEVVMCMPTTLHVFADADMHDPNGPYPSLEAYVQTMHRATNRGAENTRKWFYEANRRLRARCGDQ